MENANEILIAVVATRSGSARRWCVVTGSSEAALVEAAASAHAGSLRRAPASVSGQLVMSWRPGLGSEAERLLGERAEKIGAGHAFPTYRSACVYLATDLGMRVYV